MKLNRKEKLLFLIPLALLMLPVLLRGNWVQEYWARHDPRGDGMDQMAMRNAGWGATDCGRVKNANIAANRIEADACVVKAFKAKQPFRVRYDTAIIGSCWITNTPTNGMYSMQLSGDVVTPAPVCKNPVVVKVDGHERLQCAAFNCP